MEPVSGPHVSPIVEITDDKDPIMETIENGDPIEYPIADDDALENFPVPEAK